jgi:EmrB/QacA subfamily drug resistance transporter
MNRARPQLVEQPAIAGQPTAVPGAGAPAVDEPRRLVVFGGLILVLLLAALDSTIVATALPTIVGELGGLERLSWVVTAYLLAQTVVMPLYGKLGDLYGRKRVLQTAVLIFLAGSALCGLSRSMLQLIVFRALQGLGGGGLMVSSQAAIGDVVPPRERGRYQGIFGAAFGVASIAGPLLGGFFTTHLSWRWIFYVNLPLGVVALGVLATALPSAGRRVAHRVDYLGALLLAVALAAIVLATDLGGTTYPWSSAPIVGIVAAGALALLLFLVVEKRAAEPVLPLHLFGNRVFAVAGAVGLIVGFALFGAVTFLPLFLQVVRGQSPTASGLQLVPMMGGMLLTSIASGQIISRSGRYRLFPIVGTAVMTVGLVLLSRLRPDTGAAALSLALVVVGVGLGMVMQVLVLAVQNAVDFEDLGVATSGATLFRFIGGSVGTAVLGRSSPRGSAPGSRRRTSIWEAPRAPGCSCAERRCGSSRRRRARRSSRCSRRRWRRSSSSPRRSPRSASCSPGCCPSARYARRWRRARPASPKDARRRRRTRRCCRSSAA